RGQDLNGGARVAGADGADDLGEVAGAAIRQIVAIDRGDDHVFEAELFDGHGHVFGFERIEGGRQPRAHVAEGAGAGADFAHDHEGGVLLGPAFADIGAAGFLADGDEVVLADDLLGFPIDRGAGRPHTDPVGLAEHFRFRPVGFFRMARACVPAFVDQRDQVTSLSGGSRSPGCPAPTGCTTLSPNRGYGYLANAWQPSPRQWPRLQYPMPGAAPPLARGPQDALRSPQVVQALRPRMARHTQISRQAPITATISW